MSKRTQQHTYKVGDPVIVVGATGVLFKAHIHQVAEETFSAKLDGYSPIIYTFANEDVQSNGVAVGDGVGTASQGTIYPASHPEARVRLDRQEINILQRRMIAASRTVSYAPTEKSIEEFENIHRDLVDALVRFRKEHEEESHG